MGEKNGDAKTFWMELEDDGKVDFIFEKVQNVLHSLKQKIKDGSATNKEYIQAMVLVNEATISNSSTLIKDHIPMTQSEQEKKPSAFSSASQGSSFPEDCTRLRSTEKKEILSLKNKGDVRGKDSPLNLPYQSHDCSGACLLGMPSSCEGENPLQLPVRRHFQRRHAKTSSRSSTLHVSYKAPCGRSLRNVEEVFRYLLETECSSLFTDNFSFNTYVQLTRNYPKQGEVVSEVDISHGVEPVPVSFCNEIDNRRLPQFKYRKTVWPRACYLSSVSNLFSDSCDCSEGCVDVTKCACLQLTARNAKTCPLSSSTIATGYKYKRLQRHIPTGIYECSLLCKCSRRVCQNRVVQHGPRVRLQVFRTERKGWGVRCLDDVDRGTFVCIYSGRLLSRASPGEPTAADESGEGSAVRSAPSKRRKVAVACSAREGEGTPLALETRPPRAGAQELPSGPSGDPGEPAAKMNYSDISRAHCHSVIRSPESQTAFSQHNGKNMGPVSLEPVASGDEGRFEPACDRPDSAARGAQSAVKRVKIKAASIQSALLISAVWPSQVCFLTVASRCLLEDSSSDRTEDPEGSQPTEADVIEVTQRGEAAPGGVCKQAATPGPAGLQKGAAGPAKRPREEESPARQHQQVSADRESLLETETTSSDPLMTSSKGNAFLLDARKEGNVGRFLNHSCCPNLLVQNVFVETHDRDFPLMAFFTNRYVKARTELTWDYNYEVGTVPDKEILCQCGVSKCRKKVL